jgi:hypothetical protein
MLFRSGRSPGEAGLVAVAVSYWQRLYAAAEDCLGPDHPSTLASRHELALWRGRAGDAVGAATALEQLLEDLLRILGPNHPDTLTAGENLALLRGRTRPGSG